MGLSGKEGGTELILKSKSNTAFSLLLPLPGKSLEGIWEWFAESGQKAHELDTGASHCQMQLYRPYGSQLQTNTQDTFDTLNEIHHSKA